MDLEFIHNLIEPTTLDNAEMTWEEAFQHCYDNGGRLPFESSGDFPTVRKVLRYDVASHPTFSFNLVIRADGDKSEEFLVFKYFEKKSSVRVTVATPDSSCSTVRAGESLTLIKSHISLEREQLPSLSR